MAPPAHARREPGAPAASSPAHPRSASRAILTVLFGAVLRALASAADGGAGGMMDLTPPWSKNWTNSIAICASMRLENETDVREWVQYHRWLGVDHIYLFENDPAGIKPAMLASLQCFLDKGFVTLKHIARPQGQMIAYRQCMSEHATRYNWLAFIDLDEVLVIRERGLRLKQFLHEFKESPGLVVNWIIFGSGGREERPASGGVMRHYGRCEPHGNHHVKVIANTFYLEKAGTPHNAFFRFYGHAVDENHRPIPHDTRSGVAPEWGGTRCRADPQRCGPRPGYRTQRTSVKRVAIFHYIVKSKQDFEIKSSRAGGRNKRPKRINFFHAVNRKANHTDAVCREAMELVELCCAEPKC